MSEVGGNDWTGAVADGRRALKGIRDAVTLLRHDLTELVVANQDNPTIVEFLLGLASRLDEISQAGDDAGESFLKILEIGIQAKKARKR